MASELGSMVVTEQIDAMRALGVDPQRKLVTPRILATTIMLGILTIVADFCGILGGAAVTVFMNGQNGQEDLTTTPKPSLSMMARHAARSRPRLRSGYTLV